MHAIVLVLSFLACTCHSHRITEEHVHNDDRSTLQPMPGAQSYLKKLVSSRRAGVSKEALDALSALLLSLNPSAGSQIAGRSLIHGQGKLRSDGARSHRTSDHSPWISPSELAALRLRGGKKDAEDHAMPYRLLGNTGLAVSVLSVGAVNAKGEVWQEEDLQLAVKCLRVARKAGVNLFDSAEAYGEPFGASEKILGAAIKQLQKEDPKQWRRSDLVITTKIFWGGNGVNERGLSMKHLREGLDASLERLQLDYVDLVFCHRPDPYTPTEQIVRGMTSLVRSGKATAWGTSEWSAAQIMEALWIARSQGLEPPQFEQPEYNMMHRARFESEYFPLFREPYNYGSTIFSPLAEGLFTGKDVGGKHVWLTGKYAGGKIPAGLQESERSKLDRVEKIAHFAKQELGCTVAQLAVAWCLKNPHVTTCLLGATRPEQLQETLEAVKIARLLTDENMEQLEELLKNKPDAYFGYGAPGVRRVDTM